MYNHIHSWNHLGTYKANKAFHMPLLLEGGDDVVDYSFSTPAALGSEHLVVVSFAVRLALEHVIPQVRWNSTRDTSIKVEFNT